MARESVNGGLLRRLLFGQLRAGDGSAGSVGWWPPGCRRVRGFCHAETGGFPPLPPAGGRCTSPYNPLLETAL